MPARLEIPEPIRDALAAGADLAVSVSGGKDSQAMLSAVVRYHRAAPESAAPELPNRAERPAYLIGEVSNGTAKLADVRERAGGRMYVDRRIDPLPGEPWALDNGVFRAWRNGESYAERFARFEVQLERVAELAAEGRGPLFVVAPDLPAEGEASLLESLAWLREWESSRQESLDPWGFYYGTAAGLIPVYLAVQDGMEPAELERLEDPETGRPVLESFAGIFLGGSDAFKATAAAWRELADRWGLRLHYARATQSRLAHATEVEADSADSAHPVRLGSDRWARFLAVLDGSSFAPDRAPASDPVDTPPRIAAQASAFVGVRDVASLPRAPLRADSSRGSWANLAARRDAARARAPPGRGPSRRHSYPRRRAS